MHVSSMGIRGTFIDIGALCDIILQYAVENLAQTFCNVVQARELRRMNLSHSIGANADCDSLNGIIPL